MLHRRILFGLAAAMAAAICLLTAVRSPAADPAAQRQPAEKPKPAAEAPAARAADEAEAEAKARLVERKLAAVKGLNEMAMQLMQVGGRGPGIEYHHTWSKRQMEVEREAAGSGKERLAAAEGHLTRMRRWEDHLRALQGVPAPNRDDNALRALDRKASGFFMVEAEQWVAEAQAAEKKPR